MNHWRIIDENRVIHSLIMSLTNLFLSTYEKSTYFDYIFLLFYSNLRTKTTSSIL